MTTIGYKRIVHVPTTTAKAIRVNIEESLACPVLNGFALFMDNIYVSDEKSNVPTGEIKPVAEPLVADLGEVKAVKGFMYAPKENGEGGVVVTYKVETSVDGKQWNSVGEEKMFDNIVNNPVAQDVAFDTPVQTRMIRLIPVRVEICTGAASAANETYGVSEFKAIL